MYICIYVIETFCMKCSCIMVIKTYNTKSLKGDFTLFAGIDVFIYSSPRNLRNPIQIEVTGVVYLTRKLTQIKATSRSCSVEWKKISLAVATALDLQYSLNHCRFFNSYI